MTDVHVLVEVYDLAAGQGVYRLGLPNDLAVVPGTGDHVPAFWHFGGLVPVLGRVVAPEFVLVTIGAWVVDPEPGFRHVTDNGTTIRTWRTAADGDLVARMTAHGWTTTSGPTKETPS